MLKHYKIENNWKMAPKQLQNGAIRIIYAVNTVIKSSQKKVMLQSTYRCVKLKK